MKLPSLALAASFVTLPLAAHALAACGGSGSSATSSATTTTGGTGGGTATTSAGTGASTTSTTGTAGGSTSSTGTTSTGTTTSTSSGGQTFPPGTICNATGTKLTPPATIKNIIVILEENKDLSQVSGVPQAPYLNALAAKCGTASAYEDNCFTDNLPSLPHYLALTSGSNCNTGLDQKGTGCIAVDEDATAGHTLTTTSIFQQVKSWKSYQESMPSACDPTTSGEYATKHNPPPFYSALTGCSANDLPIAPLTCDPSATSTACTPAPSNAFTQDLANDTLAQFTFVTPNLLNEMHDGSITQADNWLFTYLPLIFQSKAYLRGDVVVMVLWDEQATLEFDGPTPNLFISPYITAGTVTATSFNHFAVLRSWEKAFGITTYLGCASGTQPGGTGACPTGSTTDVRAALNW